MDELPCSEEQVYFGSFALQRDEYKLLRQSAHGLWTDVPIRPKAFDLLRYLVDNPGRLIPPEEFLGRLWPGIFIHPQALKGYVLQVRAALEDDPEQPVYIETVRGRGYRFIAPLLGAKRPARTSTDYSDIVLVGREDALRDLAAMLQTATAGEAVMAFVTGDAGIGKTALVNAFLKDAPAADAVAVVGKCLPGSAESDAYYPVLDILAQLARTLPADEFTKRLARVAPTWLLQLPWLAPQTSDHRTHHEALGATPHRMMRELSDLLQDLSRDRPLVIVFEDIHWADRPTLDLINAIAARRLRSRLMVISTLRTAGDFFSLKPARILCQSLALYHLAKEIAVQPLSEPDVLDYLAGLAGSRASSELAHHLHVKSEGNPLYMTATLDHLVQEGLAAVGSHGWIVSEELGWPSRRVPPSLARIIEADVEKVGPKARMVLNAASLTEGPFSAAINHVATPLSEAEFELICDDLARTGTLVQRADIALLPGSRQVQSYVFRHAVFREVIYDGQSATSRALAHASIGARIEEIHRSDRSLVASVLARHFLIGEQWAKAVEYIRLAARNALKRFAAREAATALEQALSIVSNLTGQDGTDVHLDLLEDLARVYAGMLDKRTLETYSDLADKAADTGRLDVECRALLGLGYTLGWTDLKRASDVLGQAIDRSTKLGDPVARARIQTFAHAWRSWGAGWSDREAQACSAALDVIKAHGDRVALCASQVDYSLMLFMSSHYEETATTIRSAFDTLVTEVGGQRVDLGLPLWLTRVLEPSAYMYAGQLGKGLTIFDNGIASLLGNGDIARACTLYFYKAYFHLHLHDFAGAVGLCDQAMGLVQATASIELSPNERQVEMAVRGIAELGLGRHEIARDMLATARAMVRKSPSLTSWHWGLALEWGFTDACLAAGRIEEARDSAKSFHAMAYGAPDRTWRALASEATARLALTSDDLLLAKRALQEASAAIGADAAPLAAWRLHAVYAYYKERCEDLAGSAHELELSNVVRSHLANTLPDDHLGRRSLLAATPLFGRVVA
jgi:DNA-binding winged helix-turn-helix (wHTH) protein